MNHYVFMQGHLKIGINLDGRPVRSMTAAEFALRTCHAVAIDEVDQFQSRAVDKCASEIVLHSRRHWSAAPRRWTPTPSGCASTTSTACYLPSAMSGSWPSSCC
ncbi:hypothetical protein NKH18_27400 [Streptomyces sp. M10(2022)]